jgi:hypothetical protein
MVHAIVFIITLCAMLYGYCLKIYVSFIKETIIKNGGMR